MGRSFRDSFYNKSVFLGRRTVKAGECAGIWNFYGDYKVVEGPKRVTLFGSRVTFMDQVVANEHEYVVVQHRDGRKEHIRGPIALWNDPLKFKNAEVKEAVQVSSFECIVVYSENDKGVVYREIVSGPTLFVPEVNQWLHRFSWHGSIGNAASTSKGRDLHRSMSKEAPQSSSEKVPNALSFVKLRTIADQLYCHAKDVRTADDALLTIKVMIFYSLEDIERMLDSTHDPIGDFINAVCADLMKFGCTNSYQDFVNKAHHLSELESYHVLLSRAETIGYRVNKVVYRGYEASKQLQDMQDRAIKSRTEMRLKLEMEEQDHHVVDMESERQMQRKIRAHEQEVLQQVHEAERRQAEQSTQLKLEAEAQRAEIEAQRVDAAMKAELEEQKVAAELRTAKARADQQLAYISSLKDIGVDINKYMIEQARVKPDKVLQLVNCPPGGDGAAVPHIHLDA